MKSAAFFDLDKTIVSVSTEMKFILYMYKVKKVSKIQLSKVLITYLMHNLYLIQDYNSAKQKMVKKLVENRNVNDIIDTYCRFFEQVLVNYIYDEIYAEISKHKKSNRRVYIVSAALSFVVKEFAFFLNADGYYAQSLEEQDGIFTGNHLGSCFFGKKKADIIKQIALNDDLDLRTSYAYGDSFLDEYMLNTVGNPVAVNPDKRLKKTALKKKWDIVKWRNGE